MKSNCFFEDENDPDEANRRARTRREFWCMVFANGGLSYRELMEMDASEYREAVAARLLWQEEWNKK